MRKRDADEALEPNRTSKRPMLIQAIVNEPTPEPRGSPAHADTIPHEPLGSAYFPTGPPPPPAANTRSGEPSLPPISSLLPPYLPHPVPGGANQDAVPQLSRLIPLQPFHLAQPTVNLPQAQASPVPLVPIVPNSTNTPLFPFGMLTQFIHAPGANMPSSSGAPLTQGTSSQGSASQGDQSVTLEPPFTQPFPESPREQSLDDLGFDLSQFIDMAGDRLDLSGLPSGVDLMLDSTRADVQTAYLHGYTQE